MPACSRIVPAITRADERDVRCLLYEDVAAREDQARRAAAPPPVPAARA